MKTAIHGRIDTALYSTKDKGVTYGFRKDDVKKSLYGGHQLAINSRLEKIDSMIKDIINDDNITKEKFTKCLAKIL